MRAVFRPVATFAVLLTAAAAVDAGAQGAPTAATAPAPPVVGSPLPKWTAGTLDIHQISTGRGNSALFILPDGTTMLVDAGAAGDGLPQTEPHPDASRPPAAWIARYVNRRVPDSTKGLDYTLITHFHADHMGGVTQLGALVPIGTIIDRGWPDYNYPAPITDSLTTAYRAYTGGQRQTGLTIERFKPGSHSQITLRRDAHAYPSFVVQNIVGNGEVWTGVGERSRALFPPLAKLTREDYPSENSCSLGVRLTYGAFRYFTGGDITGTPDPGFPAWQNVEAGIASAIGHVDVHVVPQHGSVGEEGEAFLKALASTVLVIPAWSATHPAPDVMKRIVNSRFAPKERFIFTTDERDAARIVLAQRANSFAGPPGNVVVRVEPGGARYWVIVTSNADESDRVIAVKGPFNASANVR